MKVLWHWFTMGPYHFARMAAIARQLNLELAVVETTSSDDHSWHREGSSETFLHLTLADQPLSRSVHKSVRGRYLDALVSFAPDIVIESGYAEPNSLQSLLDYQKVRPDIPAIVWSETTERDHSRNVLIETLKRGLISVFSGALVAGTPHASYMETLGFDPALIGIVGNCVDNDFFGAQADNLRAAGFQPGGRAANGYFLYVGRFIPEKNLPFLIRAYHRYRQLCAGPCLDLVLVGSGPQEAALRSLVTTLNLEGVCFEGSKQVGEITGYYASASCLVLPSVSEPWGLVVNEAMASGIPVLISDRCGCVEDLVTPGETGEIFDPTDEGQLAERLLAMGGKPDELSRMGHLARERVQSMHVDAYAARVADHLAGFADGKHVRNRTPLQQMFVRSGLRAINRFSNF